MTALRPILLAALIAGAIAGLVSAAVQSVTTWPLIRAAETFETPAHRHGPGEAGAHEHEDAPSDAARIALTVLTTVLAGIGFALLLCGAIALSGREVDATAGLLWGLAGFASFTLAPALGLPPALPGAAEADVAARQLWWLFAACATAGGLWLIAFKRGAIGIAAAVVLLALPHLIGAPQPEGEGTAPAGLAARFVAASIVSGAVFWAVLGAAAGEAYARLAPSPLGRGMG